MQDAYFFEWRIKSVLVTAKQEIGYVSSRMRRQETGLAGRVVRFNPALLDDPGTINVDPYGAGEVGETLDVDAYYLHLKSDREVTQRTTRSCGQRAGV